MMFEGTGERDSSYVAPQVLLNIAEQECCPILSDLSIFPEKCPRYRCLCECSWQFNPVVKKQLVGQTKLAFS